VSEFVADCPRCNVQRTTFDVLGDSWVAVVNGWQSVHEVFAKCRHCHLATMFRLRLTATALREAVKSDGSIAKSTGNINSVFDVERPITVRDVAGRDPPEHVPDLIAGIFTEGASSFSAKCFNAAGAMFRLALDLATKDLLPDGAAAQQPSARQRSNLAERIEWLLDNGVLPGGLRELAICIRQNGNDAAHDGTLTEADAGDLLDFSVALLERVYTEPRRLEEAMARREQRRIAPPSA
jgi:hypothetical protein